MSSGAVLWALKSCQSIQRDLRGAGDLGLQPAQDENTCAAREGSELCLLNSNKNKGISDSLPDIMATLASLPTRVAKVRRYGSLRLGEMA